MPIAADDQKYDLIIIGAGLAGLSLACWLIDLADQKGLKLPRVCLLEPREHYENDRTWCFWDAGPNPFADIIAHRWSRWQVSSGSRIVTQSSHSVSYAMLEAGDVYHYALNRIKECPSVSLQLGVSVHSALESSDGIEVTTSFDRMLASAVIDTRPPPADQLRPETGFWQVFAGVELHSPGHGFETGAVRLMDFQPCANHVCFVYVLPLDDERLLIEWTEFNPGSRSENCQPNLDAWLERNGFSHDRILRSESGALPMFFIEPNHHSSRLLNAGVSAGWMRAATGYHFATCQRSCLNLAEQILAASENGHWSLVNPKPRSSWLDWMDKVFLRAMREHPRDAPDWFLRIFAKTTGAQVARFMNDQPYRSDALAIVAALPRLPFLWAACRG